jgi:PAT family beta-lactamase induction signal transducer AmpG
MLELTKHPSLKYFLFGSLYFAEGLIFALTTLIIVLFFNEKNITIEITTLVGGIASVPWMLKFVFGPTIDFFGNYGRKIFCIIGGIIGTISLLIVAFVDPKISIIPFTALLFIGHSGVVLLDVSTDAWAIQTTKITARGKVNAAMYIGLFGGTAIGGILLSFIATFYGFELVFITTGFLIFLSIILALFVKEHKINIKRKLIKTLLIKEFKKRNTQLVLLFSILVAMNFGMLIFIIPDYMQNVLLLDKIQTGLLAAVYPISIVIGAAIGGYISDKWGRKKILYITLVGLIISSAFLITADTWEKLAIIYAIIGFLTGASLYSTIGALLMDVTNPKIGGTQYSFLTSISNFGEIGIAMISGILVVYLGHNRFFLNTALIIGVSLLILYFVKETLNKNTN